MEQILLECAALGLDAVIFGICYRYYLKKSVNAKSVENAPAFEISSDLYKNLQKSSESIPYAVVCGVVRATSNHLQSQYLPNLKGVIREKITKERKVRWSPVMRIWSTVDQDIQRSNNIVPFALIGDGRWFTSRIEVIDPLSAEELTLTTVYDHFISHEDTVGDMIAGWFRGERTTGIQEVENMLTEGTFLTGIGELYLEDGNLKLKPPQKATFFLTPLSVDSLLKKLREEERFFKVLSVIFGCLGIYLLASILTKYYQSRRRKIEAARRRDFDRESSRVRRLADPSRGLPADDKLPCCVVCLSRPIEVIVLECGHTCMCLECSEHILSSCPVCRAPIDRIVPAYLP